MDKKTEGRIVIFLRGLVEEGTSCLTADYGDLVGRAEANAAAAAMLLREIEG